MIADLKSYPEYKESGLPWLGLLPAHWNHLRAKCLFRETDERSTTGRDKLLSVSHLTGVTPRSQKTVTMFLAKSNIGHKLCRPGDVVINTMWAWMGALGVTRYAGIVSPAYGVYRPLAGCGILSRYADHLLRTPAYSAEYQRRSTGVNSSRLRLYPEHFLRIPVVVPPPEEQAAIVQFLDWANGRLERAIRAKRKVIALLNEQKQAIISSLVTGKCEVRRVTGEDGHDISHITPRPSHLMKPSSIPWLGDIPKHWEIRRLKSLVKEAVAGPYGSSLTKSMYTQFGYRVYGQQQVIPDDFTIGDYYISKEQFGEMQKYQVFAGDVLVSVMGTVGRVAVVPNDAEPGIINPRLVRYRPDTTVVRPRWLQLVMQDGVAQVQLSEASKGTTMDGLNMRILGKLLLLKPPLAEQDTILEYVSTERQPFIIAISRLEREIGLLREYRTRLVADVVTGKLDVRSVKLPELDEVEALAEQDEEMITQDMNLDAQSDDEDIEAEV